MPGEQKLSQPAVLEWVKTLKPHEFVFFMHKAMECSQLNPRTDNRHSKGTTRQLVFGEASKHVDGVWRTTYYALPQLNQDEEEPDPDKVESYQSSSFPSNDFSEVATCNNCRQESTSWCKRMTCPICQAKLYGT